MNNKDETLNQTNERGSRFNLSPCFSLRQPFVESGKKTPTAPATAIPAEITASCTSGATWTPNAVSNNAIPRHVDASFNRASK